MRSQREGEQHGRKWDYPRLKSVAERYGTPVHVLDVPRLDERADLLADSLGRLDHSGVAYYSVKTNYLPYLCRRLAGRGFGADVVSGYELQAALSAGFSPQRIVFNGPVKTPEELEAAVRLGVRVNVDGEQEIPALEKLAARAGQVVDIGLRLSAGIPVSTSSDPTYRMQAERAALRSRFGWPAGSPQLAGVVEQIGASPHLALTAVHVHLGSQIVHQELMLRALDVVLGEATVLHRRFGLREINIGGGFGVPGINRPRLGPLSALQALQGDVAPPEDDDPVMDVCAVLAEVDKRLASLGFDDVILSCEPGRWLVSDAMAVLTRIMSRKDLPAVRWLIVDAGHNVAPWTGTGEQHRFVPIGRGFGAETTTWAIAGPLCYENDIHGTAVELPADLEPGDILCLHDTGAYSLGRGSNFIRPRAGVVALDGSREELVWRAETAQDVFVFADPERRR